MQFRTPARSLRTRLIVAFAAIIFLTLALVVLGFVFVLRQYQEQRELLRLGSLANSLAFQLRTVDADSMSSPQLAELLNRQSDELDVRIVLAGPGGMIFFDTESTLIGQRIDMQSAQRIGPIRRAMLARPIGDADGRIFILAGNVPPERPGQRPVILALASEPLTVWRVLGEMAPRLLLAALGSLLASIGVAWLVAASIARPLAQMTHAAEAIARGRYDQEVPHRGPDEVGRLAAAFGTMAREVAQSQRTLRDFVANVSHDLRTPLTSIQGFSQAMVDGSLHDPEDFADAGRAINEEAARMRRLVEDLLALSKIESGQVSLDMADHDLAGSAEQAVERVARRADEKGVAIALAVETDRTVRADGRWIERALDNLVDNAVKHTPSGGEIRVTVARHSECIAPENGGRTDGGMVVAVHNSGSYIPPDELPRVFERFYQLDKSRAGSAEGSGLGLAIAHEIVQMHGGRIAVESSRAGGTSFSVTLPCADRAAGHLIQPANQGRIGRAPSGH